MIENMFHLFTFVYSTIVLLYVVIHNKPKSIYRRTLRKNMAILRSIIATSPTTCLRQDLIEFMNEFGKDWFNFKPIVNVFKHDLRRTQSM